MKSLNEIESRVSSSVEDKVARETAEISGETLFQLSTIPNVSERYILVPLLVALMSVYNTSV